LHGGLSGFDKKVWRWEIILPDLNSAGFKLSYSSLDNEEGYPGKVDVEVYYLITNSSEIIMRYFVISDKVSPINITNHTYWNLSGNFVRSILNQKLFLSATHYLPVDDTQIPTGELKSVENTPFDLSVESGNEAFCNSAGSTGLYCQLASEFWYQAQAA
jgi:aldose 1-epimerase